MQAPEFNLFSTVFKKKKKKAGHWWPVILATWDAEITESCSLKLALGK
jgi:hypothetical protein